MFTAPLPHLDLAVTQAFQASASSAALNLAIGFSNILSPEVLVPVMFVFAVWLWWRRRRTTSMIMLWLTAGNVITLVVKAIVQRPRPSPSLVHVYDLQSTWSFPSGHSVAAGLALTALWIVLPKNRRPWWWVGLVVMLLVDWSRIVLGAHWLSDVVAGIALAAAWVGIGLALKPRLLPRQST